MVGPLQIIIYGGNRQTTNDTSSICNGPMGFVIHNVFSFSPYTRAVCTLQGSMGKGITFVPAAQLGQAKDPNAQEARQEMLSHPKTERTCIYKFTSHKDMTRRLTIAQQKNDIMLAAERISDATSILLICHVEASSRRGLIPQPLLAWDLDLPVSNLSGSFGSSERLGGPDM